MKNTDKQFIWAIAATAIVAIIGMTAIIVSDITPGTGNAYEVLDGMLTYDSFGCQYNGRVLTGASSHYDSWNCGDISILENWDKDACVRTYTHVETKVKESFICSS